MKKKIVIFMLLLSFSSVFIMPGDVYADSTRVTVFISIGFVVGGGALFLSLAFGERFSQNMERFADDAGIHFSSIDPLKFQNREDDMANTGRLKILKW